jgi:hypothetical protein
MTNWTIMCIEKMKETNVYAGTNLDIELMCTLVA